MQGPGQGAEAIGMLAGILCLVVFAVAFGLLVGAVIFRAACSIYNRLCQPENRVPDPSFGKAMLIAFVSGVAQNIVGVVIGFAIGIASAGVGLDEDVASIAAGLVSIPFSLLISAAINAWLLPTTFGRGLMVALVQLAIVITVVLVVGVVVLVFMLAVGPNGAFR